MYKIILHIFLLLLLPVLSIGQQFNYIHYDTKDGLAGSTVYDMCQDKDGFMWFATESGLSRFDGTNFKNYTVKDGLPDNEVLKICTDYKGRLWISTFTKDICYYFKGKIYNKNNDSLVSQIHLESIVVNMVEIDSVIAFADYKAAYILFPGERPIKMRSEEIFGQYVKFNTSYWKKNIVFFPDTGYSYQYNIHTRVLSYWREYNGTAKDIFSSPGHVGIHMDTAGNNDIEVPFKHDVFSSNHSEQQVYFLNTNNGAWSVDTVKQQLKEHFLPGRKIGASIIDFENNYWFCTNGQGVYKLPSTEIKTIHFPVVDTMANNEVFSLMAYNGKIVAGLSFSKAAFVDSQLNTSFLDYESAVFLSKNPFRNNRLYTINRLSNDVLLLGFDSYLVKFDKGIASINYSFAIKSISEIDPATILVGTSGCALKIRLRDLQVIDTIWRERCTRVLCYNNKYYIGTLNGLYEVNQDKTYKYLGDVHNILTRRITGIEPGPGNNLWISTSDKGIVSYRNGSVNYVIDDSNGLSSNICKAIFLQGNFLWAGTNKGLNKINLGKKDYPVIKYTVSDGLPSDVVNAVYVKDSIVWIGTPAGLTYFNENKISNTSVCVLKLMGITVAGEEQPFQNNYNFSYNDNNVRFEYVAISYKSGGEMVYYYKLAGLNPEWQQTTQTNLDYQSLPPGDYTLQLYAVNKFGIKSSTMEISLTIAAPFWKTWWFYTFVALLVAALTFWLVNLRNKNVRASLEEKNRTQQQFAALEQQALQAQMNPHFIFNCLNSIQQYILTNDKQKANEYLTGFASLVRQTLDNSGKKTITIAEEANYLEHYLRMEKMRFGDNFEYGIKIHHSVKTDFMEMPALLLQPYVENSLRHGIRYKKDHSGRVDIDFFMKENSLYCSIKDNGIGRQKAAEYKSLQHIEYQSKGMTLTQKRILLLNKVNETTIKADVKDLYDAEGNAAGTEVIIEIPM